MTVLQRINEDWGKTIIMVTHDPKTSEYANIVRHLDKGEMLPATGVSS